MKFTSKIPGLRILTRTLEYTRRPAPLDEFSDYNAYWQSRASDGHVHRELDRHRTIATMIESGESVLDIGCGDCAFLQHLKSVKTECPSLGLDISDEAVRIAREKGSNAQVINQKQSLKEQVPGQWDVVTLMEVIEHIPDTESLIREVLELRPSRIFITIPNVGCLSHRLRLMLGGRFPITTIIYHMKEHLRFWTPKDFEEWAAGFDLKVNSIHGQFSRGDRIAEWAVRKMPKIFASQVIYELTPRK